MSDEQKSFKVRDRRSFTDEGERRGDAEPPSGSEAPPVAGDAAKPSASGVEDAGPVDFAGFVAGLGAQALVLMGGVRTEQGAPPPEPDLGGARHVIGIVEMLKEKTEGNRSEEEEQLLESLLYELRMAYVRVTSSASPS